MSRSFSNKTSLGLAALALTGISLASSAAFAVEALPQGYQLAAADKTSEGKCGEGKCGSSETNAKPSKATTAEGKCGEGKCGDAIFNSIDTDHDARVSLAEFLVVAPGAQAVFAKKDTNKDGYIDEMESYISVKAAYNENGKELPKGLFSTKE
ncbi:HvfA family oxazolone/thioamide-modified RiPP metallophore [Pseudomonas frederiksbergensis]|uniref:HvfA family oxazolone/thioamide-modified RiPP metallophore n=1 Tax=Pseudomonas frederiksbergensis TaxID=104087 RepID=UPI003D1C4D3C